MIIMNDMHREIGAKELREIQLAVLREVDILCENEGLRYCLCGGSLLGAIRHQGFIPWDDDIDILMPRDDYERFLKLAPRHLGGHCRVATYRNDPLHPYPFAKVCDLRTVQKQPSLPDSGIGVDVFPMDGLPDDISASDAQFRAMKCYDALLWSTFSKPASSRSRRWIRKLLVPLSKLLGRKRILKWLERQATKYAFDQSEFVAVLVITTYGKRERMTKAAFSEFRRMPFEGEQYPVPVGYHEYLSSLYGDYMQLPPIEKRFPHHHIEAFWL